ncbi:heparanase-like [Biomphalaria glabrata]|uniref:Heparanase-like n=1 Tax=Biomphalaria glabrata TaxID=6526 RepID=A0A9W2YK83_BIOGL|nr:heparanase-like [Biomphalaria glabrata]
MVNRKLNRNGHVLLILMTLELGSHSQEEQEETSQDEIINVHIRKNSYYNISRSFLNLGFPHLFFKWSKFPMKSPQALSLSLALPDTIIRIYGTPIFTPEDEVYFAERNNEDWEIKRRKKKREDNREDETDENITEKVNGSHAQLVGHKPRELILTKTVWQEVVEFATTVKWDFMFGFTAFSHINGVWDTRYAITFLEWCSKEKIPIPEFQLGNEPNLYAKYLNINGSTVANDFSVFRNLLKRFPFYNSSKIIGPDVTRFNASKKYFESFLKANGCDYVDEIAFHHYYFKDDAKFENFMDVKLLNNYKVHLEVGKELMEKYNCSKPLRLTETSSASGGGVLNLSDTFVAGFTWMDKFGQSALHNITKIFRHSYFGGIYSLVNKKLKPNPDYYLTLMFKRYVEGPVLTVKSNRPRHIRIYANCAREYKPGSLVIYLMNLSDMKEYINFTSFSTQTVSVFRFTAYEEDLQSKRVLLNGEELVMTGSNLPYMKESRELGDRILIPPYSYNFIFVTEARVKLCINYFQQDSSKDQNGNQDTKNTVEVNATTGKHNTDSDDDSNNGCLSKLRTDVPAAGSILIIYLIVNSVLLVL